MRKITIKKIIIVFSSVLMLLCALLALACSSGDENLSKTDYLILNRNEVLSISVGQEKTLTYNTNIDGNITFESGNSEIVSIDSKGLVKGISIGETYITAQIGEVTEKCFVEVKKEELLSSGILLKLNKTEVTFFVGGFMSCDLTALFYDNGQLVSAQPAWNSQDKTIATVDANGKVTGISEGETTITATVIKDGDTAVARCKVVVAKLVDLYFTSDSYNTVESETVQIEARLENSLGQTVSKKIAWSSLNEEIATIDQTGLVTGVSSGSTNIVATVDGAKYFAEVVVWKEISSVSQLLAINGTNDYFILAKDLTLMVNGIGSSIGTDNAFWTYQEVLERGTNRSTYSVIPTFNGTLIGNGHKITLVNTVPLADTTACYGGGLFGRMDGVVENTVFDIQLVSPTAMGKYVSRFGALASYVHGGTFRNCYIKANVTDAEYGGMFSTSGIIRSVDETSCIENNIFEVGSNIFAAISNVEYNGVDTDVENQRIAISNAIKNNIVIGERTTDYFLTDGNINRQIVVEDSAVYTASYDLFDTANNGKYFNATKQHDTYQHAFQSGAYASRTEKMIFGEPWAFSEKEIKLCDKSVLVDSIDSWEKISTAEEFLAINKSSKRYVLTDNITITNNQSATSNESYLYMINNFMGRLDGNGYKVTYNVKLSAGTGTVRGFPLFSNMNGRISNVNFELNYTKGEETWGNRGYCSLLCHALGGTIENCFISASSQDTVNNDNKGIVRNITATGLLKNNVYVFDKTQITRVAIYCDDADGVENQIIITGSAASKSLFVNNQNDNRQVLVPTSAVYDTKADFFNATNYGKVFTSTTLVDGQFYYKNGSYVARTSPKFDFGNEGSWTFDYTNGVLKLCNKVVLTNN